VLDEVVEINVDRQNTELAQDFRRKVCEHPQVQACDMISGTVDFMLKVVGPKRTMISAN